MSFLQLDNLDDRREITILLRKLHPRDRLRFLADCCKRVTLKKADTCPGIRRDMFQRSKLAMRDDEADRRLTTEVYFDLWALASQYGLDLGQAADRLEGFVRDGDYREYTSPSSPCNGSFSPRAD